MSRIGRTGVRVAFVVLALSIAMTASVAYAATMRASLGMVATQGNSPSWNPAVSADGRYVAFCSEASNLVPFDTNGQTDVFVRDRDTGITTRVSVDSFGLQATNWSGGSSWIEPARPAISADGRFVAFRSQATNLVAGDSNGQGDIFVHDRLTATTARVSVDSAGAQSNGYSDYPSLSADGRYVAFMSAASNLVTGDANGRSDIFVHDRTTGATVRASVDSAEVEGNHLNVGYPVISGNGGHVAFMSDATNLVAGDTNGVYDYFVRDLGAGTTARVSVSTAGAQADAGLEDLYHPALSDDGRYVAFVMDATNLVAGDTNAYTDIFVRDTVAGTTERVSVDSAEAESNSSSYAVAMSGDGSRVAFRSFASNLVASDTNGAWDIFVRDRELGTTSRVSVDSAGAQANSSSHAPAFASGGWLIAYTSSATNLVAGDTNGMRDVFTYDMAYPTYLTAAASSTKPAYGASVTISGVLKRSGSSGPVIGGQTVVLQRQEAVGWVDVASATGSSAGAVSFSVMTKDRAVYRLSYTGISGRYLSATSTWVTVTPKVYLGNPVAPTSMSHSRYYTVYGTLKPRHTAGTKPVRIYRWRKVSGKWKAYSYVNATAYDYSSYSRYKAKMRLSTAGSWRLRAYAPGDALHSATWSAKYDYVRVY